MAERDNKGRFPKGKTGNPGGRPSVDPLTRQKLRNLTPKAIKILERALDDYEKLPREAMKAAEVILAYDWGKPVQAVDIDGKLDNTFVVHVIDTYATDNDTA